MSPVTKNGIVRSIVKLKLLLFKATIMKSCVENYNEARCMPGIAVSNNHPEMKDVKGTILCCEGNLCNSSNKLYNGNVLFIAVLLGCIYGISE